MSKRYSLVLADSTLEWTEGEGVPLFPIMSEGHFFSPLTPFLLHRNAAEISVLLPGATCKPIFVIEEISKQLDILLNYLSRE